MPEDMVESGPNEPSEGLACNACRKAKLRCSRDKPDCLHCRKTNTNCIYEAKRVKPGLKAGAVENLHRRLDHLERRVSDQGTSIARCHHSALQAPAHNGLDDSAASSILALLAKELPKLTNPSTHQSNKRRRLEHEHEASATTVHVDVATPLLPDHLYLETIVAAYFSHVHPWIPMIHQARFSQRMNDATQRKQLSVILQAMSVAASKFAHDTVETIAPRTRDWVIYTAMDSLSLENLQALIIIAFDDIGNGNVSKAWSIIGSMTRTVEYMGLAHEQEAGELRHFCQPSACLQDTSDWTEVEERRRVFWNVFLLDRLCSVTMGWNTSLTSDDVYRRLPCDGHLWRRQSPVLTPYFGIWDKSKARIGTPIGYVSRFQSPTQGQLPTEAASHSQMGATPSINTGRDMVTDMSTVGALAYSIEATESMSRVMSYFLQQKVDVRDQEEISSWLTRFKELDLRLVHWKMLLPQRWKANPNLTRHVPLMDPNLTTAHVTHNASMILLHQLVAYPPFHWGFRNRLPSTCSAEACYTAGVEIATITEKYLGKSLAMSPVGNQYAFCLFIAARALLAHWRYTRSDPLASEFWSLLQSLEEMSRRWTAFLKALPDTRDLFIGYAHRLRGLYELCTNDETYQINVMGYTNDTNHRQGHPEPTRPLNVWPHVSATVPLPDLGLPLPSPDFNTITMLDQNFMDTDRVIAFDDGSMFTSTFDAGLNAW